ncbi:MAG TPA: cyclopropane-fatty-acyl-phospholipid synthase family protein [Solirubrobacteraceae bacterium]|jgi:cyclopropane-fatty-acyl-phospholipid synthase|nr:cyclopropane-fatty-acyl-phospholipid synthase family protein [Solirubrobacteraceae bacterium]
MTPTLAELFEMVLDGEVPVGLSAYDGSVRAWEGAVGVLELRTPRAVRYIASAPGELGLARAYVMGDLEIHGDLHATIHALLAHVREEIPWSVVLRGLRRWMLRRPPLPPEEAPPAWRRGALRHTKGRDARAISHHYDLPSGFYELLLGESMVYSCAIFATPGATLQEAQREKLDLICRKLDLRPGERLLDVGAGWGGLVLHAAEHHGARALGVTLSRAQAEWAREAIARAGLEGRAEVRFLDWRDVLQGDFDAISSVGAMEHIGSAKLGSHFAAMAGRLREGGRMLNHTITRASGRQGHRTGPFIDRYVFPDGELQSLGMVIGAMHDHGLEVRHEENLREHYAMTLREWGANLDRHWGRAVAEVGERRARAWRLYMAMSRVAFDLNRVQIHQILGVRLTPEGRSGMPPRPTWGRAERPAQVSALV